MTRSLVSLLVLSALVSGCKKQAPAGADLGLGATAPAAAPAPVADSPAREVARQFSRVQFAYDSATLDAPSKAAVAAAAEILRKHPEIKVQVQGHCDERGTTEYNLALGNARASAVRSALAAQGVLPSQLETISFGEERPLAAGDTEVAWAQNRRAEFRVLTDTDAVVGSVD